MPSAFSIWFPMVFGKPGYLLRGVGVDTMFDTSLWSGGSDQELVAKKIEEIIAKARTNQLEHEMNQGAQAAKAPTEEGKDAAEPAAATAAATAEAEAAEEAPEGLALAGVVGAWMFPKDPDPQLYQPLIIEQLALYTCWVCAFAA
jgi:hypothetical protein